MVNVANLKKMNSNNLRQAFRAVCGYNFSDPNDRDMMIAIIDSKIEGQSTTAKKMFETMKVWFQPTIVREMSDARIRTIRAMRADGATLKEIGDLFNKRPQYIRNIVIGKLYASVK